MEDTQVSVEELKQRLAADFDQLVIEVAQAMNAAQAGRIIADTEEPVRQAHAVFRERAYEKAIRLLQDRQEAFSPSARRLHLGEAKVKYAVSDGAEWIANEYQRQLPMLDAHILDYYHLREHMIQASQVLYDQDAQKAEVWREEMMGCVWEQGSLVLLDRLGSYLRHHRTGSQHEALEDLRDYVRKRVAMTDYPTFRHLGYDCGSGPTESLCGQLTNRLKGPGMRWDQDNAEAMMALASLDHSGQWDTYWNSVRAVAA